MKTIQESVDEAIKAEEDSRKDRKRSGCFSPSSFGKCFRAQIWNRQNKPVTNPIDERTLRTFKCGKLFHDFVQQYLPKGQVEVKVKGGDDIFGYADYVTDDVVYDLKSVHSRAFWHMKKDNFDICKDKIPNILQVMSYAKFLGKKEGCLVFISKDDLCISEYVFFLSTWEEAVDKEIQTLRDYWKSGELPKAEPRCYNGKECQYCSYQDACKELEGK